MNGIIPLYALGLPNFGLISVRATISGLETEILVLSSSNLLEKESAFVYQHFKDLKVEILDCKY